jgi:hypothetical protein
MLNAPLERVTPFMKPGGNGCGAHIIPLEKRSHLILFKQDASLLLD